MMLPGMKNGLMRRGPRSLRMMRVFGDALDAADAGADHHAGGVAVVVGLGLPAGIGQRLVGGGDSVEDEVADLAQFLRLENRFGIEGAVAAVAARNDVRDLAGQVVDLEFGDAAALHSAGEQLLPAMLEAHAERRDEAHPRDDDASHREPLRTGDVASGR